MSKESAKLKLSIVGLNILITVLYVIAVRIHATRTNAEEVLMLVFIIPFHVLICLFVAFFYRSQEFILSALVVLLVGFSTCYFAFAVR